MKKALFFIIIIITFILISCKTDNHNILSESDNCENVLTKEKEDEIKNDALMDLYNKFKENHPDYNKSYDEWLDDLNNKEFSENNYIIPINGEKEIYVGYSTKLIPDYIPKYEDELFWESLNNDITTVNNGYVYGLKSGYATIILHNKSNTINGVFVIEVKDEPTTFTSINLGGYHIKILAFRSQFHEIDPFDEFYDYPDKIYKQSSLREIERKYNCEMEFIEVPVNDQNIYQNIKYSVENGYNYYDIAYTNSSYLYPLINDNLIINLSSLNDKYHNDISNRINYKDFVIGKSLYGISDDYKYYNEYLNVLVYNKTLLESFNIENPAKLYNEGKWSFNDFNQWLTNAKESIGEKIVISTSAFAFAQGIVNAHDLNLFNLDLTINTDSLRSSLDYIKSLYEDGFVISDSYVNLLQNPFNDGNALMTSSSLDMIYHPLAYGNELNYDNSSYGFVPYPYPVNYPKNERKIGYNISFGYVFINNSNNSINSDIIYQAFYDYLLTTIKNEEVNQKAIDCITYSYLKDIKGLDEQSIKTVLSYPKNLQLFDGCSNQFESKMIAAPLNELFKGNIMFDDFINNELDGYNQKVDDMKRGIYPKPWE